MKSRTVPEGILVIGASLFYTFALPPFDLWPLAFLVAMPLYALLFDPTRRLSVGRALLWAMTFGEVTTLAVGGPWLLHGATAFFDQPLASSLLLTLAITFTHAGLFIGAGVSCAAACRPLGPIGRIAAMTCAWVTFELLRSRLLYGCPWNLLGHALHASPTAMQAAAIGGVPLLSAAAVATGAALGCAWVEPRVRRAALLGAFTLAAALWLYGSLRLSEQPPAAATVRAAVVQANVGRRALWQRGGEGTQLDVQIAMSSIAELGRVDLVVWGENAVPFTLGDDLGAVARIAALADRSNAPVLVGAPRSVDRGDGSAVFHNSLYVFEPGRPSWQAYDKSKLLPYIEQIPHWARGWIDGSDAIEYSPGEGGRLLDSAGLRIGPSICFEATYAELSRQQRLGGARLLVNVSNDSWFGAGSAQAQHFAMTKLRSVETALPLVRVANTGITAAVDAYGRVLDALEPDTRSAAVFEVPLSELAPPSYTRIGDVFAYAAALVLGLLIVRARTISTSRAQPMGP